MDGRPQVGDAGRGVPARPCEARGLLGRIGFPNTGQGRPQVLGTRLVHLGKLRLRVAERAHRGLGGDLSPGWTIPVSAKAGHSGKDTQPRPGTLRGTRGRPLGAVPTTTSGPRNVISSPGGGAQGPSGHSGASWTQPLLVRRVTLGLVCPGPHRPRAPLAVKRTLCPLGRRGQRLGEISAFLGHFGRPGL